jgi:hypothetical protein
VSAVPTLEAIATRTGELIDGQSYSFTSNDSIAAPPTVEFLGALGGVIDGGTPGEHFTRANWAMLDPRGRSNWQWSTTRTRNRSRTLYYDGVARGEGLGADGNCRGSYQYDVGPGGWKELYVSPSVYWQVNPSYPNFQWKTFRLQTVMDGAVPEVREGEEGTYAHDPQAYMSNSVDGTEMPFSTFTIPTIREGCGPAPAARRRTRGSAWRSTCRRTQCPAPTTASCACG